MLTKFWIPLAWITLSSSVGKYSTERREDDRDDARLVDLERDVGDLPPYHPPAHHALGVLDGDAALPLLHEDDGDDDPETEQQDEDELAPPPAQDGASPARAAAR